MREVEWAEAALQDMAGLDKGIARRVKQAVERFAETGAGNVKRTPGHRPARASLTRRRLSGPLPPGCGYRQHSPRPQSAGGVQMRGGWSSCSPATQG